jgi:ankyrin repeat protein
MTLQQLPERANLAHLKKQAKSLLQAARSQDSAALERFRAVRGQIKALSPKGGAGDFALHDAQFVIAREYGFKSWNDLREHVEEQSFSFATAVDEFVRCATGNAQARALRLLEKYPGIAHANLYTELVLGDAEAAHARLQNHSETVSRKGGVQNWEPFLYVCHSCLHRGSPDRALGLVTIARELLRLGANPNSEYEWNWHPELPRTALWGALIAMDHHRLAEVLLESGANATDGVSMHIAAGSGNLEVLEILHRFGANVNGIPGGVPPLRYVLGWAAKDRAAGVHWLLEHGADANLSWGELGDAPLHVAAERWDLPMVEALVAHGADIHRRRSDGRTAHTLAALHGNQEIAGWLLRHGAKNELSPLDNFVAACARGDRTTAEAMLGARPELRTELRDEHHLLMHVPAERGDSKVLETMLACGFDPNARDHDSVTALHRAAMAGRPEAVRVLLGHGASVDALDGMFAANPLVWATEGWNHPQAGSDHVEVARLLIAAGTSREWAPPEKAPDPEGTQERLIELCRAAELT